MSLFNFAIASIVDANTGNGVNHQFIERFVSATSDYEKRGREIRANSVIAVIGKIKALFKQYIEDSKARAQKRQAINALSGMSDHMLQDIGLTHVDMHDLRWGMTTLGGLNARRELNRALALGNQLSLSPSSVNDKVRGIQSANQAHFESKKCA